MKKFILLLLFILIFIAAFAKSKPISYYDLIKSSRSLLSETKYQKWINNAWQDSLMLQYSNYPDSVVYVQSSLDSLTGNLKISGKETQVKNQENKITKILWQNYDNGWVNSYKYLFAYDGDKVISSLYEEWQNNSWIIVYQGYYDYDDNGNCTTELWKVWINNTLVNSHQFLYEYDENSNPTQILYQYWSEENILTNSYKKTYTYSDTLLLSYKKEVWQNDDWVNDFKYEYSYDDNAHLQRTDYYDWLNEMWTEVLFAQYTYEQNNITQELWKYEYNGFDFNYSRNLYFYQDADAQNNQICPNRIRNFNYPNPFNPSTTIFYQTNSNDKVKKIEIFNIKGRKIKAIFVSPWQGTVVWNGTDQDNKAVSSGIYFYRIISEKSKTTGKMILLK